ncbi:MAG: glycosyltransferase family 39 protein [Methylophilaceae bacterium]|nr:glycosyltransferase family 39 protein [Methylophilaceae bacterium]
MMATRFMRLLDNAQSPSGLPWMAALCGALLAGWVILQSHGAINSDGILYVEAARLFALGQWQEGFQLYNWPLYSLLIALVHHVSGLGLQASAHGLAIVAFALTSAGLTVLVREAGGGCGTMVAAMLLLFASPYLVGDVLPMVVRDHLFWAAHVWSLVFFLKFYRQHTLGLAFGWGVTAILAVLLRIEALTYLVLLPWVVLADSSHPWRARWRILLRAHALLLLGLGVGAIAYALTPGLQPEHLGRLRDPITVLLGAHEQLSHGLDSKARIFAEQVLGPFLEDYASSGLLLTLGYILLVKALGSAGWLQLATAVWGCMVGRSASLKPFHKLFAWLILLGMANGAFILLAKFFLPGRYLLPIAFIILVYAAFGGEALYKRWLSGVRSSRLQRGMLLALGIAFVVQFGLILRPQDPEKMPTLQAARWLKNHVSKDDRIYYDARRIRYYVTGDSSDRTEDPWPVVQEYFESGKIRAFDYAVVRVSRKNPEREDYLTARLGIPPVARFEDGRGNRVLIYRTRR